MARDQEGRFERDAETARRDYEAASMRARGLTYADIAAQLGMSRSSAYEAVQRALEDEQGSPVEHVRLAELDRLDRLTAAAWRVMESEHVMVQQGKVVHHDGIALRDHAPVLEAVDRLVRISERRARLLGLDAPTRLSVDAEQLGREINELLNGSGVDAERDG